MDGGLGGRTPQPSGGLDCRRSARLFRRHLRNLQAIQAQSKFGLPCFSLLTQEPVDRSSIISLRSAPAPTARDADALATALMILGPEEGMRKAEEMNLIARFCSREGNGTQRKYSTTWRRLHPAFEE